jgi:hypothetical protein
LTELPTLSASKIKTLDTCSWLYQTKYIFKLPDTANDGSSRGSVVHLILEMLLTRKEYVTKILAANDVKAVPSVWRLTVKDAKKRNVADETNLQMINEMTITGLKYDFYCKGSTELDSEVKFCFSNLNPRYTIIGFIDKLAKYPKSTKVSDFKTSKQKYTKEELSFNHQALMYSLAVHKLFGQIPDVEFIFLRFPKSPIKMAPKANEQTLGGFESYLAYISDYLANFTEENGKAEMAAHGGFGKKWACGKTGFKEDGTPHWICPFRKPFNYYTNGKKTAFNEKELEIYPERPIVKKQYAGCPAWQKEPEKIEDLEC